jgi:V8-like Glu-specific endopeptidase
VENSVIGYKIEDAIVDTQSATEGCGVMVGANDVLTAAHVFYSHDNGGAATSVVVTPSLFNDYKPYGIANANNLSLTQEWIDDSTAYNYDYGVISLDRALGYQTGWVDYGSLNDLSTTAGYDMYSYGFASDTEDGNWLIKTEGNPDAYQDNILFFTDDLDVTAGQSGSGVMMNYNDSDVVIGVVSHESRYPDQNGVITLNTTARELIEGWVSGNDDDITAPISTTYSYADMEKISLIYYGLLDRTADQDGLDYWLSEMDNGTNTYKGIVSGFLASNELMSGDKYNSDNETFVNSLYSTILGRDADSDGLEYWISELSQTANKENVVISFLNSSEFINANSLNNYSIWHTWYNSFDREVYGSDDAEVLMTTSGNDYISAGDGDDTIYGLAGSDYIVGGAGNDTITGGEGRDFFAFDLSQSGMDTIKDFDLSEDVIKLANVESLQTATSNDTDLVLYVDEDTYIILTGLTQEDYSSIVFV